MRPVWPRQSSYAILTDQTGTPSLLCFCGLAASGMRSAVKTLRSTEPMNMSVRNVLGSTSTMLSTAVSFHGRSASGAAVVVDVAKGPDGFMGSPGCSVPPLNPPVNVDEGSPSG